MLRKTVVILTMLLCSMATQLYALGLGTVTVESSPNQPLRIRIELLQIGDARLQDIKVSMASGADFERFNIERASFLSNVRFSVESSAQGNVIILTTSQIVREPYLSFILDTRWPNGRLLSEHTVLFDLPVFAEQQSTAEIRQPISPILQAPTSAETADPEPFVESSVTAPVSAPTSTNSAANLQPEVISLEPEPEVPDAELAEQLKAEAEPEESPAEPETAPAVAVAPEEELADEPVEEVAAEEVVQAEEEAIEAATEPVAPEAVETDRNDTLSDIALQVRPNPTITIQQTMLAIQELNPDAFADGNINRLRSGKVLRVPNLEEIQSIDPRDAIDEVTRQNQEFAQVSVQPLAVPPEATPEADDQPQGQLSVVSSDDAIDASNAAAGSSDADDDALDQRVAELEAQLAQRQEEVDRVRIEREELASRMADLEAQIAAAQEIILLQDIQLAQLQESLAEAAAEAQLVAEQQALKDAAATEAALPVDSPSSFADDMMRILTGNSIFILFGIVLVILLLVVLMLRRNRTAVADDHDIDEIAEQDFDADSEDVSTEDSEKDEAATEFQDYDSADLDVDADDDFLDLDAEAAQGEAAEVDNEVEVEVEFDLDTDGEVEENETKSDVSEDDLTDDDDLEFLSDDDVELESVEEVEDDDMLSDDDETAMKLELAYAYQKMGDTEGAKEILQEVIKEGSDAQIEEASKLLGSLDDKSD